MNEYATRAALGISVIAVSGLLIVNRVQKQQLKAYEDYYIKSRTWMKLSQRMNNVMYKNVPDDFKFPEDLSVDVQAYLLLKDI